MTRLRPTWRQLGHCRLAYTHHNAGHNQPNQRLDFRVPVRIVPIFLDNKTQEGAGKAEDDRCPDDKTGAGRAHDVRLFPEKVPRVIGADDVCYARPGSRPRWYGCGGSVYQLRQPMRAHTRARTRAKFRRHEDKAAL